MKSNKKRMPIVTFYPRWTWNWSVRHKTHAMMYVPPKAGAGVVDDPNKEPPVAEGAGLLENPNADG